MNRKDEEARTMNTPLEEALAGLAEPSPTGFELRILRAVGIPENRYDTYTYLEAPGGGLYVASRQETLTGAALTAVVPGRTEFEERHLARTGRSAISTAVPPTGVRTALRTGRAKQLRVDLSGLTELERAVLAAVRSIPRGQMRPVSWVAHEAGLAGSGPVTGVLAVNPLHLLIPCHRVADDDGQPCDAAYGRHVGDALRRSEGIDPDYIETLLRLHTVFLGSDTTHIYCHPTCAHARRITAPHQVPFRSAGDARRAGYRPCKSCRPLAA
ncbi:MGMT family protein [Streptomyces sp. NPDC053048]|uniref:MGMT family protein n=1 Tax=Streptomyces sp. NPDC053048 TaxID=3365694 RepID=UPI0037D4E10A